MNQSFDLLTAPWIPGVDVAGRSVELGLRDALVRAHELRELHGESPLVTAALHRLLLAVLHRMFGPPDLDSWEALWEAGRWDAPALDAYLDRWRHRFDLFDPDRPFFQAPDPRVRQKSVASLIHEVASGNNATLFDHHTDEAGPVLTPAQAARMLVAGQIFGLAGLSGLKQTFTDGPCASGIVFLVAGDNLFETLALNMLPYPDESVMPSDASDRPAWEMNDPLTPDRTEPFGYLDYLTWQNRRVQFFPQKEHDTVVVREMTIGPALRLDQGVQDPMTHYRVHEKRGPIPLSFDEERALWRDSGALLELRTRSQRPPLTFNWLAELVDEDVLSREQTRRYLALGMSKTRAKVNFYRSERMPLPLTYLQDRQLVERLEQGLQMSEGVARRLWAATRTLATFVFVPDADREGARQPDPADLDGLTQQWAVERRYWSRLEFPFYELVEDLPASVAALFTWRETLRQAAWEAFEQVARDLGHDPGKLKAVVRARSQLAMGLAKELPDTSPVTTSQADHNGRLRRQKTN